MKYFIIGQTKIIIFKKPLLFLVILTLFNCGPEANMYKRDYIIKNNIDRTVELKFYNRRSGDLKGRTSKILSGNQSQLIETLEQTTPFNQTSENLDLFTAFGADSVRIIFDNIKVVTHVFFTNSETFSEPINRNVFLFNNYENIGNERFLYEIIEEDYENAVICDGNCD